MTVRKKHTLLGKLLFAALVMMPVLLWVIRSGLGTAFDSPAGLLSFAGKACALSGLAMYCLMPVLSMRHRVIERLFGGLDTAYSLHRSTGKFAFVLLVGHPVLLLLGRMLKGASLLTAWNWMSLTVMSGIVSLAVFSALTVMAVYAHIKHQKWIFIHRLFGWLLPIIFFHALVARSQIVQNKALFIYMLGLGVIGFSAFLYRSVFSFLVRRYRYVVEEVNRLTPLVTELVLKPSGIPLSYSPGQFAYLSLQGEGIDGEAHPYSFTTANNGPYIRFVVKELGDDTAHVKNVKPGMKAYLEGPHGSFSFFNSRHHHQVWVAGGVGITPFLSMARSLTKRSRHRIHLFYAADKLEDAVFLKELMTIRKTLPENFEITLVNREWSGFVTIETLESYITDLAAKDYLLCGPPAMISSLRQDLKRKGVSDAQIYGEEFSVR